MPDNRPAVYLEGDTVIYRASALGHPLCQLWAARCGLAARPFPDIVQRGMDEGTALEPIILDLLAEKFDFTFAAGRQFQIELNVGTWNGKTFIVRGKVDEIGAPSGRINLPIDVKAFIPEDIEKFHSQSFSAFPRYAWQQSAYGIGFGTNRFYMPLFNKETWQVEEWSTAPHNIIFTRDQIRDRILEVEEWFDANTIPPCPAEFACPYYYLHEEDVTSLVPDSVVPLVRARIKLSEKIKNLESARRALDSAISPRLSSDVTYTLDDYTVTIYANPSRFNTAAAKRLLTEAEVDWENDPEYWIPGKGTQIRMTPKKASKDANDL